MKMLEKGKEKIQEICNVLRQETLEPAKEEAELIIENAKIEAEAIIAEAQKKAANMGIEAKASIQREREIFHSSLKEASKLSMEALKQEIEQKLFHQNLSLIVSEKTADPKIIESLISALVGAIQKEGLSADFSAIIPKEVDPAKVNELLKENILKALNEKGVVLGSFKGGAKLKLHDKKLTIDISDEAITQLLETHLRKDFRKWLF